MPHRPYDVIAVCAAVVEINIQVDEAFIARHGFEKNRTNPVDPVKLAALLAEAKDLTRTSGGPGTNVATGVSLRGGTAAVIGTVANDDHGAFYAQRLGENGVGYAPLHPPESVTTCVVVLTTPDKERTFAFSGDAAYRITPAHIDAAQLAQARIAYFDSYLWLSDAGRDTVLHAATAAKRAGCKIALALNDAGIIGRNREAYLALARKADILLGDVWEFMALLNTASLDETVTAVQTMNITAAITAASEGVTIVAGKEVSHVPAQKVTSIVDTCGAGDQFAAGFLSGLVRGGSPTASAVLGVDWASDVLTHAGAEPRVPSQARRRVG